MAKNQAQGHANQPQDSSIIENSTSKFHKKVTFTSNDDIISNLPDEIITHILSFIPTKAAVATSVISKRWNRVWISVPNLDFYEYCSSLHESPVKRALFFSFVDRVLSLNNVLSVREIYLKLGDVDCELTRITAWMSSLVKRDAEKIHIRLPMACRVANFDPGSLFYSVSDCFFTQNNLVELSLENVVLKIPSSVCFPSLKMIDFEQVQLVDDDSMKNLLSGCPVLTRLSMDRGSYDNAFTLYFCSSTLNYLRLHGGYCERDIGYDVVIDAPNLNYLHIIDEVGMSYDMINISSLVCANLDFEEDEYGRLSSDVFEERLFDLLRKTSHVKKLVLTSGIMRSFENVSLNNLPVYKNLTKLTVEIFQEDSWPILPLLFHSTPNLVNFTLKLDDDVHPHCAWYQPIDVPRCFLSSIKNVTISIFKECDEEMEMVFYILNNAMVLKKLSIVSVCLDLVQETNILKTLLTLPRSSSACQVEYRNL